MRKIGWWKTACAVCVLCAVTAIASPAQTFTTLHSFDGTDGNGPLAPLLQASDGNLYGTASTGGVSGGGTVFKMTPAGTLTTLYSFCSQSTCTDGANPVGSLLQASDGGFYGTTEYGGAYGYGTVFKITSTGTLTTLYSFCSQSNCGDGEYPRAGLVQDSDGDLYGTTYFGGANGKHGTVFRVTPNGLVTTLYSFCSQSACADGGNPTAALIQGANGSFYGFYGTTSSGGDDTSCAGGCGTVFSITPNGNLTTLHSFERVDGAFPFGALAQGTDKNLYGTTYQGGVTDVGTVFEVSPSGSVTTLYSFCSQTHCTDGEYPQTALIQATDGNLYGTTQGGGIRGNGTVFKITPGGRLTTLYRFCLDGGSCSDGSGPVAVPVQATDGTFFGTTQSGGINSDGTVFSLSVGLAPFVETQPTSGKLGASVKILGTNLTGATSVTFNGTPAVFEVVSSSFITTTVPAGATTGKVQVVTPGGTLTSNVPFRVLP
jgi:uncharacterized repeat protein (TIGR03803 family)